jgi:PAS domain S-box-containing protein
MKSNDISETNLESKVKDLEVKLQEANDLLHAISTGSVDAFAIQGEEGYEVYTLKSADRSYRILVEEINEGAILLNKDAIVLYSNESFARIVKTPLQKVFGASFFDFISENNLENVKKLIENAWEVKSSSEIILKFDNQEEVPVLLSAKLVKNISGFPVLGVIVTDLSIEKEVIDIKSKVEIQNKLLSQKEEEIKKEKAVREEAEKLKLILESLPDIAFTAYPDGRIIYMNKHWYGYTNLDLENTRDFGWLSVIHPDDIVYVQQAFSEYSHKKKPLEMKQRIKGSDGDYKWHLTRAILHKKEIEDEQIWIGTLVDIQDLEEAKELLKSSNLNLTDINKALTKSNKDLDNFVYTASHDLKAPVVNMKGLLNELMIMLEDKHQFNGNFKSITTMLNASVNKLFETINDLAEITRIQKVNEGEVEDQDIATIFEDVNNILKGVIDDSGAEITTDFDSCSQIKFASKNLQSILYNLLSNSIKYRSPDRKTEILIKTEKHDRDCVLIVKDNGLGMESNKIGKAFGMFKRLHDHVDGTGIGLYIVKRIVDDAGGKIEVKSEVNKGTTFKVFFIDK